MPLQPGPFILQSSAGLGVTPGVYDFTDDAITLAAQLNSLASGWDSFILDLTNFSAEIPDIAAGYDLDGIQNVVDAGSDSLPLSYLDDVDQGFSDGSTALSTAVSFAPAQAWTNPGAAFTPPDSALTLVPEGVDPNAFIASPNTTVGQQSGGAVPFIGLDNLTRVGATNFVQGDSFQYSIFATPGTYVSETSSFNGKQLPTLNYGPMDNTGQMIISGTLGPDDVGTWSQQWLLNDVVQSTFTFLVAPAATS